MFGSRTPDFDVKCGCFVLALVIVASVSSKSVGE